MHAKGLHNAKFFFASVESVKMLHDSMALVASFDTGVGGDVFGSACDAGTRQEEG